MRTAEPLPPSVVRRAAAIARGPHACPSCECPTWAEPPVPWTDLRDYLVRCDACERPICVRVDRERVLRRGSAPPHVRHSRELYDPVAELLDRRDRRAFLARTIAASPAPLLLVAIAAWIGGGVALAGFGALVGVLVGAMWGPALMAMAWQEVRGVVAAGSAVLRQRRHQPEEVVEVEPGRWDQWMREERRRQRERAEQPEAVLRELERVLDDRELRRVRMLAERGEVPPEHLDDLLRFRRSWGATVA